MRNEKQDAEDTGANREGKQGSSGQDEDHEEARINGRPVDAARLSGLVRAAGRSPAGFLSENEQGLDK
jgi:hypothetical protein